MKEHENICLNHYCENFNFDENVDNLKEFVLKAMRKCVNNFLNPEYFLNIADATHKKDEKRLASLQASAPIDQLKNCLLMIEGQYKLVQEPWCLSFKKGASQSLSIAAAAILAQGQKDHDDHIKSEYEKHHANL